MKDDEDKKDEEKSNDKNDDKNDNKKSEEDVKKNDKSDGVNEIAALIKEYETKFEAINSQMESLNDKFDTFAEAGGIVRENGDDKNPLENDEDTDEESYVPLKDMDFNI